MTSNGNYFAYGSNLLSSRMHVNNKDAIKTSIGRLKDWKLTFSGFSPTFWQGATANIVPSIGDEVIGVIWNVKSFDPLDKQEFCYEGIEITVEDINNGQYIKCRTYIQDKSYEQTIGGNGEPSKAYKNVVLAGASESKLPIQYINKLIEIKDNGIIPDHIGKLVPEALGVN